jgi:hypothetical protein
MFERCKELLRHAIEPAIVPAEHEIVVMTDASSVAWAGFVATCPTAEPDKPMISKTREYNIKTKVIAKPKKEENHVRTIGLVMIS